MQVTVKQCFDILKMKMTDAGIFYASKLNENNESFVCFSKTKLAAKDSWYKEVYVTFMWETPNDHWRKTNRNTDHALGLKKIEVLRWNTKDFLTTPNHYVKLLLDMGLNTKKTVKKHTGGKVQAMKSSIKNYNYKQHNKAIRDADVLDRLMNNTGEQPPFNI